MNTLLGEPETARFGSMLRQWRTARRHEPVTAGLGGRHLGPAPEFSRNRPRAAQPRNGATACRPLDVPLAERNALLVGAGYAPIYGERSLGAPELAHVRRALEFTLRQREPYPALVMDGYHNIVMRNDASRRIFELFRGPVPDHQPINGIRTVFDPNGLASFHRQLGRDGRVHDAGRCSAQIAETGNDALIRLRDELLACPACPRALPRCRARCGGSADHQPAPAQGRSVAGVLLRGQLHRPRARHHAAGPEDRVLLSRRRGRQISSRAASPPISADRRRLTILRLT